MNNMPPKLRKLLSEDPFMGKCARFGVDCDGRITWEHVWIYAGRQIQEAWAIIPLCEYHHAVNSHQDGGNLSKEINQWISLQRATSQDLQKYPKKDWKMLYNYLHGKCKTESPKNA